MHAVALSMTVALAVATFLRGPTRGRHVPAQDARGSACGGVSAARLRCSVSRARISEYSLPRTQSASGAS